MPWKESYKTRTGQKRYKIVTQDAAGKKASKSFDRSKDADAYLLELKRKEQLGHLWQDDPETFGAFAGITVNDKGRVVLSGDGWFERYRTSVRQSTYDRRHSVIGHLRPLLDVRLDRLTPALIEDLTLTLQKEHARQAKFVDETIKMILRSAKVRGQRVNPDVFEVRPPSYHTERRRRALNVSEIETLAEASDEPHLIRVAAYTGLRQGELFALRDEDIDLQASVLHVRGTAYKGERDDRTKTASGERTISLPKQMVTELKLQLLKRKGAGIVFPSPKGSIWDKHNFNTRFREWRTAAGMDITFHDLRHTFASLMVETEVHPKVLQEMMGHKHFNVTMDLYTHLAQAQKKEAVVGLEQLIARG